VLITAILIGFCFLYMVGYSNEFGWSAALTIGAIMSPTDPVAVISLLKSLGAPIKFNLLLEGESLLNDGTAMVFYIIFSAIYKQLNLSPL
jgi:monovalent cation:H+ antiporter, CPA1 family